MSLAQELFKEYQTVANGYSLIQELEYYLQLAVEENDTYLELTELAQLFGRSGYLDLKIALLNELWNIKPDVEIGYLLAQQAYDLDQIEQAAEWIDKLSHFTMTEKMRLLQAHIAGKRGDTHQQKMLLDQLLKENPQSATLYYYQAQFYLKENDFIKAKEFLNVILDYFPQSQWAKSARSLLINTMIDSEFIDPEQLSNLIANKQLPEFETATDWLQIAKASFVVEDYEQALAFAKQSFELDKDNLDSIFLQLQIAVIQQDVTAAKKLLEWLERNIPIGHELIGEMSQLAAQMDLLSDSLIEKLIDYTLLLEDNSEQFQYIQLITHYYVKMNQAAPLEAFADMMAEEIEEPASLSYAYAKYFELSNNFVEAEAYYLDAIELALNIPTLVYELAQLYLKFNEKELAAPLKTQYQNTLYDIPELRQLIIE
uniref:tetratricopeptide repeat protein n=1 Tax=Globicatella sulfidifaciens TaxID=136093 RepID=UPI0023F1253A|nr:tetratricopeptide repeat protein [Globicatella sulfidifaciens]